MTSMQRQGGNPLSTARTEDSCARNPNVPGLVPRCVGQISSPGPCQYAAVWPAAARVAT
jgi:hypothetical protein